MKFIQISIKHILVIILCSPVICFGVDRWNSGETLLLHCKATLALQDIDNPTHQDHVKSVACLSYLEAIKQFLYELDAYAQQNNICFPDFGISNGQAARIIVNFSEEYPEKLREHKLNFVIDALSYAFPCN